MPKPEPFVTLQPPRISDEVRFAVSHAQYLNFCMRCCKTDTGDR